MSILKDELERMEFAHLHKVIDITQPIRLEAIDQGIALVKAAEHIIANFGELNGDECKNRCGKCIKCLLEKALDLRC